MYLENRTQVVDEGVVVRCHSPLGLYPSARVETHDYAFLVDDDLILTITRFRREESRPYSDMEWAETNEVRLWASFALSTEREACKLIFHPLPFAEYLPLGQHSLAEPGIQREATDLFLARLARSDVDRTRGVVLPPKLGGPAFRFAPGAVNLERQRALFAAIDPCDRLTIRGLGTLVKSQMLAAHLQFLEEAAMALFVSLDASLHLILRRLRKAGISDPTPADADRFIIDTFGPNRPAEKYFTEYYDRRIATLHPESRFGTSAFAPLEADDYFDLYDDMLEVYGFLLLQEIPPTLAPTIAPRLPETP